MAYVHDPPHPFPPQRRCLEYLLCFCFAQEKLKEELQLCDKGSQGASVAIMKNNIWRIREKSETFQSRRDSTSESFEKSFERRNRQKRSQTRFEMLVCVNLPVPVSEQRFVLTWFDSEVFCCWFDFLCYFVWRTKSVASSSYGVRGTCLLLRLVCSIWGHRFGASCYIDHSIKCHREPEHTWFKVFMPSEGYSIRI